MEGKKKWGRVLSVILTIIMMMTNTSMTTFADIIGGVVQQKEENNEQDGQGEADGQKPAGEESEEGKQPEDGEEPEDGKESEDEDKTDEGKEPEDEKEPEDADKVKIHVLQEVLRGEEENLSVKYTVNVTNTEDKADTGADTTGTETGVETEIDAQTEIDTEVKTQTDIGVDTAEIDTVETDIDTYKESGINTTAGEISLKVVIGAQLSYYKGTDETGSLNYIEDIRQIPEGIDLHELNSFTAEQLEPYASAVLWDNQSLSAGETAQFVFYAHVSEDAKGQADLPVMYFVNGEAVSSSDIQWENAELLDPDKTEPQTYTYEDDQVLITVEVPEGVELPEGAELKADQLEEGTQEFESAIDTIKEQKEGKNIIPLRAYDVYFLLDGEKIEPTGGFINISMAFKQPVDKTELDEFDAEIQVIHIDEANNNFVENVTDVIEMNQNGEIEGVAFSTESLSPLVLLGEVVGKYPYSDKTLEDYGGDYSLYYILNNFNIFSKGDALSGHCIGPAAVGGEAVFRSGNGNEKYKHKTPTYFEGTIKAVLDGFMKELYVGEINKAGGYSAQSRCETFISRDNKYIDFDAAFGQIQAEANTLANTSGSINISASDIAKAKKGQTVRTKYYTAESFWKKGVKVTVLAGYSYVFENISEIGAIDVNKEENPYGNAVLIDNASGAISLPQAFVNGTATLPGGDQEIGEGLGVVYVVPNAISVNCSGAWERWWGHIVAPQANVYGMIGDANGCTISASYNNPGTECHMWPYNGDIIKPTSHTFGATKTVDGAVPSSDQKFTFLLDELKGGKWINIQTTENILGKVVFRDIGYSTDSDCGEHWYRICERQDTANGYKLSTAQYILKVNVDKVTSGTTTTYTKETTYYKVDNSDKENISPESILTGDGIDLNKLVLLSGNDEFVFNNTTIVENGSLKITKAAAQGTVLDGKTFYFQVKNETGEIIKDDSNGSSDTWSITFSDQGKNSIIIDGLKPGQYTVTEVADAAGTAIGEAFAYTVTTAPSNGVVTVTAGNQEEVTVTNEEKKKEIEIELPGTKTINGTGIPTDDQQFDFVWVDITGYNKLVNKEDITKFEGNFNKKDLIDYVQSLSGDKYTVVHNNGGVIKFPKLTYTKEDQGKTYYYAIYETDDKKYDLRPELDIYVVKVNLSDWQKPEINIACGSPSNPNKGNNCTYHGKYVDEITFDNTTEATPAKVQLNGTKTVSGGTSGDVFEFGMYSWDEVQNDEVLKYKAEITGAGNITFPELQFTTVGTYTYIIREIPDSTKPYTYDESYYKVIIDVVKKGNKLEAAHTITKYPEITGAPSVSSLDFTNTIRTASAEFKVKKTYAADENKKFDFILTPKNNAPMPAGSADGKKTIRVSQKDSTEAADSFGPIAYAADGDYYYEIKEENAGATIDGITYSDVIYEVKVKVSTQNGNRTAVVEYRKNTTPESSWTEANSAAFTCEFTNTYAAEGSIILEAHKELQGKTLENGMFTFKLFEGEQELSAATNRADGSIVFEPITYTETGKHTYTIKEEAAGMPGVTYDKNSYDVTVEVTDNGQGGFNYNVDGAAFVQGSTDNRYKLEGTGFVNIYRNAEAEITPKVTKTLTGRDMKPGEFTFYLYEKITGGEKFLTKGTNGANGEITFEKPIKITLEDMKNGSGYDTRKEFAYVIREHIPAAADRVPGVDYDTKAVTLTVVADYDADTQEIILSWKDGRNSVVFENSYTTSKSIGLSGTKVLNGRRMKPGEFQFEAEGPNKQKILGTNDADGKISFNGEISITLADMKKEGGGYESLKSFLCTVRELQGSDSGIVYDKAEKNLTLNAAYEEETGELTLEWAEESKSFTFANAYDTSTTLKLTGTKELTGRTMADNEFIFNVTEENSKIYAAAGYSKADGTIEFEDIVIRLSDMSDGSGGYLAEKIFTYTVEEVSGADGGGIIYDTKIRTIKVKAVYDAESGSLTAALIKDESDVLAFKNSYVPSGSIGLIGTKLMEGRGLRDKEFSFVVLDKDNANKEVSRGVNDAKGNIIFELIEYKLEDMSDGKGGYLDNKIFTYTVKEKPGNLQDVTYDDTEYEVKVEVKVVNDTDTKKLEARRIDSNTPLIFTNSYRQSVSLKGNKSLLGRKLEEGEFTFTVTPESGGNAVSTGISKADGTIEFTDIEITLEQMKDPQTGEYLEQKQFKYIVEEDQNPALPNIIYDKAKEITLNASYNKVEDKLTLEWAQGDVPVKFENRYTTEKEISLTGTKKLDGRNMTAGEFQFEVVSDNGQGAVVSRGTNDDNGKITFTPDIKITSEQMKDENGAYVEQKQFLYMVREVNGNTPGITYDDSTLSLILNASYNHSSGDWSLAWDTGKASQNQEIVAFTNIYESKGSLTIKGSKKVNGNELSAAQKAALAGKAEFTLARAEIKGEGADSDQAGAEYKTIESKSLGIDGTFAFKEQTFSKADAGKTYSYKVTESKVESQGFGIDSTEHIFTVKVTDNGDGSLNLDVKDSGGRPVTGDISVVFDNSYKAAGQAVLTGSKKLLGERHEGIGEGEFKFVVLDKDGKEVTTGSTAQSDRGDDAEIVFAPIFYTDKEAGAEYTYTVKEVSEDAAGNVIDDAIDYDATSFEVKVKVEDKHNGELQTTVTYPKGYEAGVVFVNSYKAEGQAVLEARKTLKGKNTDLQAGEFSFIIHEVIGENRVPVLDGNGNPLRAFNGADGSIQFEPIKYTQDDQGIHYYEITEEAGNDPSITYDTQPVKATVTVKDENGDGTLDAIVSYETEGHTSFTNIYRADGSVTFTGTKKLLGNRGEGVKEGEFTFVVTEKGTNVKVAEGITKEGGRIEFTTITYEAKDVGTHTYVITEETGKDSSIQYSGQSIEVSVTVTEQGAEALETSVVYPEGGIVFENEYRAEGAVALKGTKRLTGGRAEALKDGEFAFTVTEGSREIAAGSSKADGTIVFSEIKYTQADIGTHTYKISEVPGTDSSIEYSREVFTVTVEVTDLGQGRLQAVASYPAGGVVFENRYHTGGRLVLADIVKVLEGSPLAAGQFTFELRNSEGRVLQTKTNGADGRVSFDALEYTESDLGKEFTYTIAEVKKDIAGVIFDESVYTVKVLIGERINSDGTLNITSAMSRNGEAVERAVFTNRFAGSVTLQKNNTAGAGLAGARFMLYAKAAGTDTDGWTVYTADSADGVYTTDRNGVITVNNLPANDYYFIETEAPAGYIIQKDADGKDIQYHFTIGIVNGDVGIVENAEVYPKLTVINEGAGTGGIRVTKRTEAVDEELNLVNLVMEDATFYVNLFKDAEGKQPYNDGTPTAIHLVNAASGTAVFDNLETGTYYVFETDAAGNAIPMNEILTDGEAEYICTVEPDETNEVGLDLETQQVSGTVNIVNRYFEMPGHASIDAWLNITKKVLRGSAPVTVNDTFYAGIYTKDEEDVYELVQVAELKQNETVRVQVALGGENGMDPITYYVFETDKEGNQIDPDVFKYEVSIEGGEASLDTTHTQAAVTITNEAPQQEPTPTQTVQSSGRSSGGTNYQTTGKTGVKTGDDTPIALYILLFVLAAAMAAVVVIFKRRRENEI